MAIITRINNGFVIKQLCLSRLFDASAEKLFDAWTVARQLQQWWGPHGFTNPVCRTDVRPGGQILIHTRSPDGLVFPLQGAFHHVHKPLMLVFSSSAFENDEGDNGFENMTTVWFTPHEDQTRLSLEILIVRATAEAYDALEGLHEGWQQSLDKLETFIHSGPIA